MAELDLTPRPELVHQLSSLGVEEGGVLLVHTSFRAVAPIQDGPQGLIAALHESVGKDGTLVMPAWSSGDDIFDPGRSEVSKSLGIVAQTFWRMPEVLRSDHVHAFAASGPLAREILRDPLPLPPHIPASPVGRVHELDGQVLLLGVNHDADTTIHLAEILGGAPYRTKKSCMVLQNGTPTRLEYGENDHCCERFALVDDWLLAAGLQSAGVVGHASARLARSRAIVECVVPRLQRDPLVFLHDADRGCAECDEARASV
jgi:aminoglycoside N3'-acetyltransferase